MLSDEAYFEMRYSGTSTSIAALPGMAERTVILYTFSKKYAMTGWRLGAAIAPAGVSAVFAKLNTNNESCTTQFVQWAGLEALTLSLIHIQMCIRDSCPHRPGRGCFGESGGDRRGHLRRGERALEFVARDDDGRGVGGGCHGGRLPAPGRLTAPRRSAGAGSVTCPDQGR